MSLALTSGAEDHCVVDASRALAGNLATVALARTNAPDRTGGTCVWVKHHGRDDKREARETLTAWAGNNNDRDVEAINRARVEVVFVAPARRISLDTRRE